MYSMCLFCHTDLGANEAVEHFPVGRRLAFDAAKGWQDAMRAAARLLPRLNAAGASSQQIKKAVVLATEHEDASIAFEQAARLAANTRSWNDFGKGAMLTLVPPELRLALEMVSHEESERRALEGELAILEEAWREAEEIAGIADDLFLPEDISKRLTEMKGR
jgi:hypothetical protein